MNISELGQNAETAFNIGIPEGYTLLSLCRVRESYDTYYRLHERLRYKPSPRVSGLLKQAVIQISEDGDIICPDLFYMNWSDVTSPTLNPNSPFCQLNCVRSEFLDQVVEVFKDLGLERLLISRQDEKPIPVHEEF